MADKEPEQIQVKIVPINRDNLSRIYANYFLVSHSPNDFNIDCVDVPPIVESDAQKLKQEKAIAAPIKARIVVPISVMPGLIKAMQEQWRKFEEGQRKGLQ